MSIVPSGSPPWLRVNDFSAYGGHVDKQNLASRGVINPKTDVGAEAFSRFAADLAAVQRTAPFAEMTIVCNDSSAVAPTFEFVTMMTGVRTISYAGDAAPTGYPSGVRNGNGDITITFASSYTDPYGVTGAFVLKNPRATVITNLGGFANPEVVSDTVLRVRAYNLVGAALFNARVVVCVSSGAA